jgi:hypothetical protein
MLSGQCFLCSHFHGSRKMTCDAFQNGIPKEMFTGEHDHREPWPNADDPQDNGVRFEPIEDQ